MNSRETLSPLALVKNSERWLCLGMYGQYKMHLILLVVLMVS